MIIQDFDTSIVGNTWKNWLFIRVTTDTGLHGVGEASLNGFARTVEAAIHELGRFFLGKSPYDIELLKSDMMKKVYSDGGQIHRNAIAAVECACWDIIGKDLRQPIYNLWGGKVRDQLRLYANGWYQTEREPELFHQKAKEAIGMGYTALKFDPFGDNYMYLDQYQRDLSIDIIRTVREAVPPTTMLMVEGHCRFDVATAIELSRYMAPFDITWFEEPVSYLDVRNLAEVANRSEICVATGENFISFQQFFDLLSHTRNIILQPDIANIGGLSAGRRVCELADGCGVRVAPHDAQGSISKALCVQLGAAMSNIFIQEDFEEFNPPWTKNLVHQPLHKRDGFIMIPDGPGLGIEINFDEVAEHPYSEDAFIGLFDAGWEKRTSFGGQS